MDGNEKDTKQNSVQKTKRSAKRRNPNLRLVKNGDKPIKDEKPSKGGTTSFGRSKAGEKQKAVSKEKKEPEGAKKAAQKEKKEPEGAKKAAQKEKKKPERTEKAVQKGKKTARKGKKKSGKEKKPEEEKKSGEGNAKRTGKKAAPKGNAEKPEGKEEPKEKTKENGEKAASEEETKNSGEKTKPEEKAEKSGEKAKPEEKAKSKGETKEGGKKENPEGEKKKTGKKKKKTGTGKGKKPVREKAEKRKSRKKDRDVYRDKPELGEWFAQHKSLVMIGATVAACCVLLTGIYYYITTAYEVTTVYVDGNVHYTNEEVMDMVMEGRYGNNSLYLAMKYKDKGVEGIPFVEKMDVNILTPNTIRISVYEKALAGYVEYLGRYMYFDRDGTVVESSAERTRGIPQVTGLHFDYVVVNEPLPVENDEIFKRILDITQLLNKYELMADKIFFDSSYDLTLFFEDVRVTLGSSSEIDQKIIKLKNILPELEGKSGTLQMENYTEDTKNITFRRE